jgi:hypothetical protein
VLHRNSTNTSAPLFEGPPLPSASSFGKWVALFNMHSHADSVNTAGMDLERMLFCVLHHTMDAEAHNIPPGEEK